jgi:uncharacterized protein (TIGR00251 family)
VRVTPRARGDAIDGFDVEGVLRVRVAAPPVDGKANDALIRVLSTALSHPTREFTLVSGASARLKLVEITGLSEDELRKRLAG